MKNQKLEWQAFVVQPGARMHFAVALGFSKAGHLGLLATDFCGKNWIIQALARWFHSLHRYKLDIDTRNIKCDPLGALLVRAVQRHLKDTSLRVRAEFWYADRLARVAIRASSNVTARVLVVYGYDVSSLRLFKWAKQRKIKSVLEQCVAPRRTQIKLLERQKEFYDPHEYSRVLQRLQSRMLREESEWEIADLIVAPSDFVRDELVASGVRANKVVLIPYGFSPPVGLDSENAGSQRSIFTSKKALRVLYVGSVDVRKGAHDLMRVANMVEGLDVVALGPICLPVSLRDYDTRQMRCLGPKPFDQVLAALKEADVFVLPSYLEGSATVSYEALASGLPVITTKQSGTVVEDGVEGFVLDAGDCDALAKALVKLRDSADLRERFSKAARSKAELFTRDKYSQRLIEAIETMIST